MHIVQDSLSQRGKGTWRFSYHPVFDDGESGEREFVTIKASTKRDARRIAGEMRAELEEELRRDAPTGLKRCGLTLLEWQEKYAGELHSMGVIRQSTADSYVQAVQTCTLIADKDVARITEQDVKDCLADMMTSGRLSKNTVVKHFRIARSALEHACDAGLIARNPARRVKTPKMDKTKPRSLRENERRKIDELIKTIENPLKTASAMGLYMGVRGEEACGFRWCHRSVEGGLSFMEVAEVVAMEAGRPVLKRPKTDESSRRLPESKAMRAILDERKKEQMERCEKHGVTFSDDLFVLGDIDGKPLSPDKMRKDFRAVCQAAGIECTFHWLRHTFATRMIAQGVNARTVAQWLGHADPGFTLRTYCDADEGALIDSLSFVDKIAG